MTSSMLVIAMVAFLAGAATAEFVLIVVGIRKVDRPRDLPPARVTPLGAAAGSVLKGPTWPIRPGAGDQESNV